jgi:hypothetical protein
MLYFYTHLQKWSPSEHIPLVQASPSHDQQTNNVFVSVGCCHLKRRVVVLVQTVDITALVKQGLHTVPVSLFTRAEDGPCPIHSGTNDKD